MTPEEYKEKQKDRINSYIIGSKDSSGNIIKRIFAKGDEYLIYEIKTDQISDSIKVLIDTKVEDDSRPLEYFYSVREKFTKLKGLLFKVVDDTSIKARISHILSHAITGNPDEANKFFENLIEEINIEYKNQSNHRIRYLLTTMSILIIGILISIYIYYTDLFLDHIQLRYLILISTASSVGGFISVAGKLHRMVFEKDVNHLLYILYAVERILIALLAGVVIYFAIKSNLVFGFINTISKPIYGYLVFSAVAGFSETFVPNLLINLSKKEK